MKLHFESTDISHNARLKRYPDGSFELLVCDRPIWKDEGWERADEGAARTAGNEQWGARSGARARRRAKANVRDIALCTPFTHFITFTLDRTKIDRYDPAVVFAKLHRWLDNRVRRNDLSYILIPEYHKDGALHFHGLINDCLPMVDSGKRDKGGHTLFNLPAWGFGFSTAIALYGERSAAVSYVCKYISKTEEKIGGRWYYSGGKLTRPDVFLLDKHFTFEKDDGYLFGVPEIGAAFKIYRGAAI